MNAEDARALLASARVARLATVSPNGRPHLVPITFALPANDTLVSAVDAKPKRTLRLQRLRNIAAQPRVAVLADHYEEDWGRLWWARADGIACVREPGSEPLALAALVARYSQYAEAPPAGPIIVIEVTRWSGWSADGAAANR